MRSVKLKDLVNIRNEREDHPASSQYDRFVGLEHYDSGEVVISRWGSTERLDSAMKVFHENDILVARRNVYLKRASAVNFDGLTSGDSIVLYAKDSKYASIIPFVLNTDSFWDYADKHSDGSMSKRLSPKTMLEYEFHLPDDEGCKKLSDVLWAMHRHRKSYQNLITATDELVKSQFIEMSEHADGKPTRMGDIATYINGAAFKPKDWSPVGKPIIRIQNLNDPSASYNYFAGTIDEKYLVHPGEVLVSWATHLEAYVWSGEEAWLNQHIFRTVFDKKDVNRTFFIYAANAALKEAFKKAHGFKKTMEHIKRGDFEDAIVYLPDKTTQDLFATFAEQADKSKFAAKQALADLTAAQKALMRQYLG